MSDKPRGAIAIDSVPWTEWSEGVRFASRYRVLSDTRNDGRRIGVSYEELPPGKQSCPFHYHMLEEEHIVALEGEATLRLGEERYRIKAGDYVGFPAGRRAGHCLVNESDKPLRGLYHNIDWIQRDSLPEDTPYFYARYRKEYPVENGKDYVILDTKGKGHYVGTVDTRQALGAQNLVAHVGEHHGAERPGAVPRDLDDS